MTWRGTSGRPYSAGPRDVVVPANATVNFPLSFKPGWVGEFAGTLTLQTSNHESNAYALKAGPVTPSPPLLVFTRSVRDSTAAA